MSRPWIAQYAPGVPADVEHGRFPNAGALLETACAEHAGKPAFVFMDRFLDFAEVDKLSAALGAWLQQTGLEPGARVALMMPNLPQYPIAIAAVLRAGYVVTNVNPLYTPRELEHQLRDSGAEAIVVLENFAATLAGVLERTAVRHVVVASVGDLLGFPRGALVNFAVRRVRKLVPRYSIPRIVRFNDAIAVGLRGRLEPVPRGPDDVAFLQYTGGTTGASKGAVLLHRNVVANLMQMDGTLTPGLAEMRERVRGPIVQVCALPIYHVAALVCVCLIGMRVGVSNLLIPNPRDLPGFVRELGKRPFHILPAVNTLLNMLAADPGFQRLDHSSLQWTNAGATAVQRAVAEKWQALTGVVVRQAYGLTESMLVSSTPSNATEFDGAVGVPIPSTEVAILDADGRPLPFGEVGEIAVRGPQVMAGYWQRPDDTARALGADGYLRTGDLGRLDTRGSLHVVDRKKDLIIVSGFNVYPNEVEDVVMMLPGVAECAAVAVPDEHSGEAVKLYVVRRDPDLTEEQVAAHCKQQLTGYKRPKHIEFRDALPKTPVGKILRRELRQ
jgi:long-chain acyl-CoA synthetase